MPGERNPYLVAKPLIEKTALRLVRKDRLTVEQVGKSLIAGGLQMLTAASGPDATTGFLRDLAAKCESAHHSRSNPGRRGR